MNEPVNLEDFLRVMRRRWAAHGNVLSWPLEYTWQQLCYVFNLKFLENDSPERRRQWRVCAAKTGTGKSESTIAYGALLSRNPDAGMLVVVPFIDQANKVAEEINSEAGRVVAVARHHENADELPLDSLKDYPVLVITHTAYVSALERSGRRIERVWQAFTARNSDTRRLIVIDEAIDVIEISNVNLDNLRQLMGEVPQVARDRFPREFRTLQTLEHLFERLHEVSAQTGVRPMSVLVTDATAKERLDTFERTYGEAPDHLTPLREYMREHRYVGSKRRQTFNEANERAASDADRLFGQISALMESFVLYSKSGDSHSLSTARLLVPVDSQGCVVLDATADNSPLYDMLEVKRHELPTDARRYDNVTFHVSYGHSVGKSSMAKRGKEHAQQLIANLSQRLSPQDKVFLCTHAVAEQEFAGYKTPFELRLGHWGKVDGSNEWRDCNVAVIASLPYRNPADAALSYFATQGTQSDDWLHDESLRTFTGSSGRSYVDIKSAIETGWIVSAVIQAVNRIRCRSVSDSQGNCLPADVYLLLPNGETGKAILEAIREAMPGSTVKHWEYSALKRPRKTAHLESLKVFIRNIAQGAKWSAKKVREELGIPRASWERLVASLSDPASELYHQLNECGVAYRVEQVGDVRRAFLVRD